MEYFVVVVSSKEGLGGLVIAKSFFGMTITKFLIPVSAQLGSIVRDMPSVAQ